MATLSIEDAAGEHSPSRLLRRITRLVEKRIQARFSDARMSFEEWMALKQIVDGAVENAGDLARDFGIGTGPTTRLIDSLESLGLVERDRTRDDRRVVLVKPTERGKELYLSKIPDMIACWNDLLRDFEKNEVDQLITLLTKLQEALLRQAN